MLGSLWMSAKYRVAPCWLEPCTLFQIHDELCIHQWQLRADLHRLAGLTRLSHIDLNCKKLTYDGLRKHLPHLFKRSRVLVAKRWLAR